MGHTVVRARALVRIVATVTLCAAMTLAFAGGVDAGKSTYQVTVPDGTYAGSVTGAVTKTGSASSGPVAVSDAWVIGTCYQDGDSVYVEHVQTDATGQATLTLGPTAAWQGGDADCTATARLWDYKRQRWNYVASTEFHVDG